MVLKCCSNVINARFPYSVRYLMGAEHCGLLDTVFSGGATQWSLFHCCFFPNMIRAALGVGIRGAVVQSLWREHILGENVFLLTFHNNLFKLPKMLITETYQHITPKLQLLLFSVCGMLSYIFSVL